MNPPSVSPGTAPGAAAKGVTWRDDARRLLDLGWPIFTGQVAVLLFGTIDTILLGRLGTSELAALALGTATYVSVFVGLMGVVMAVSPLAARAYGAGRMQACGDHLVQAVWLALLLSLPGAWLLRHPEPMLALAAVSPELAPRVRAYLGALAWALPASLVFAAWRGFHGAIGRPRVVMSIQLAGLLVKLPLSTALAWGLPGSWPSGEPLIGGRGVEGCAWATATVFWLQVLAAMVITARSGGYGAYFAGGWTQWRPRVTLLMAQLRLGVPMGLSIVVEVTGFTFMAFFIARTGEQAVAAHQIAANMAGMLFMMPLALGNATTVLVGQRLGAGDEPGARRIGHHALTLGLAVALAAAALLMGGRALLAHTFTSSVEVATLAASLLAIVAAFHVADAVQAVLAAILRAHHIVLMPLIVYAAAVWGIGLAGGCWLGLDLGGQAPASLHGAPGFWVAALLGLVLAALGLGLRVRQLPRAG